MKLYQHQHVGCEMLGCLLDTSAWLNRFTIEGPPYLYAGRNAPLQPTVSEEWCVWLPSYGMERNYNSASGAHVWSQRGFWWNLRSGEFYWCFRPVQDADFA